MQVDDDHDAAQAGPGDRPAWPDDSGNRAGERESECLQGEQAGAVDCHRPREEMFRGGLPDEGI
jgi:hypothetical protein